MKKIKCNTCHELKLESEFNRQAVIGHDYRCKKCKSKYDSDYKKRVHAERYTSTKAWEPPKPLS